MNILEAVKTVYPNAGDCVNGHIGAIIVTEHTEIHDDKATIIKVDRCDHCQMPCAGPSDEFDITI